jgi:hypothetical protein
VLLYGDLMNRMAEEKWVEKSLCVFSGLSSSEISDHSLIISIKLERVEGDVCV